MAHAAQQFGSDFSIIHLGDAIDYGMRPNEVLSRLHALDHRIIANLAGNHEQALFGDGLDKFSSARALQAHLFTRGILDPVWRSYLQEAMCFGQRTLSLEGARLLLLHGDLSDPFWGGMPSSEMEKDDYKTYDYVICGHTHIRFMVEMFYADSTEKARRGRCKTVFVNPGSIGQPRNHNCRAQYGVIDLTEATVHFYSVPYNIIEECSVFDGSVDTFYRDRLLTGI